DGDGTTVEDLHSVAEPQFVSVPPAFALEGVPYSYQPRTTLQGDVTLTLADVPEGRADDITIADGSRVVFTPTAQDATSGSPLGFTLVATADGGTEDEVVLQQAVEVEVAGLRQLATRSMLPEATGQVVVSAPTSAIRGAGVNFPAGALASETTVSVSELTKAPSFPNGRGSLRAVDFGPSGTLFKVPATVALPFDTGQLADISRLGAYTYNGETGRWESLPVVSIDEAAGLMYARASHFSIYAAAEVDVDYDLTVEAMDDGSICEGRLSARGELGSGIADLDVTSVNNLSPAMQALGTANVEDLLDHADFIGSVRFARVITLTSSTGASSTKVMVSTLNATAEGSTLTHTDAFGNVILELAYDDHREEMTAVSQHLSGAAVHGFFDSDFGSSTFTVAGRLHVVYSEADQSLVGADEGGLGVAAVEVPEGAAGTADVVATGFDVDCDRIRGAFDSVDDSLEPKIVVTPTEAITVMQGTDVTLSASVVDNSDDPSSTTWEVIAGADTATLSEVTDDPSARTLGTTAPGFYTVLVTIEVDDKTLENRFNVQVLPQPAVNTLAVCVPTALSAVADEGQTVTIFATVDDAQTPTDALEIEWGLAFDNGNDVVFVESSSIEGGGAIVGFTGHSPGTYEIGCRAHDGEDWGDVGTTQVGVVAVAANQAPVDFLVSPSAAQAVMGETVTFNASATDPDGDTLTFSWSHPFGTSVPSTGASIDVDTTSLSAGLYTMLASVDDGPDPDQYLPVTLRVLEAPIANDDPDEDNDGFPASLDCNDSDASVNPDQQEICGSGVDENCDGEMATDDCDEDGFVDIQQGGTDCDDTNPDIHPEAHEYCDGVDNNCAEGVDELYGTGDVCMAYLGVCASEGTLVCSPDRLTTGCAAQPKPSYPETCDQLDNDCDGQTDEDDICTTEKLGKWFRCQDQDCTVLDGDGFEFLPEGLFRDLKSADGAETYVADDPVCVAGSGEWSVEYQTVWVHVEDDGQSSTVQATFSPQEDPDTVLLSVVDPDTQEVHEDLHRRVSALDTGACSEEVICGAGGCPQCACDTGAACDPDTSSGQACDCDPDCGPGVPACEPTGTEVCDARDNDCDGQFDEGGVCDFSGASLPVGIWWECAEVGDCSSYGDTGFMFVDDGSAYFFHALDELSWNGVDPYCAGGEASWTFDGSELHVSWTEGDGTAGWATVAVIATSSGMVWEGIDYHGDPVYNELAPVAHQLESECHGDGGSDCSSYGDQGSCESDVGCTWDAEKNECMYLVIDCAQFDGDQTACEAEEACAWNGEPSECHGGSQPEFDCYHYDGDQTACESHPQCVWSVETGLCLDEACQCDLSPECDADATQQGPCGCDADCGQPPVCEPTGPEVCDAADNDCDGESDEDGVCDFSGAPIPEGIWWTCASQGDCSGYGNLGFMFVDTGEAYFLRAQDDQDWSGA
ncbi:MAG: MopE-related protein, partial [Myxococcales bacterium]|nr:MopE-related protein [Myxococcales bacterium]